MSKYSLKIAESFPKCELTCTLNFVDFIFVFSLVFILFLADIWLTVGYENLQVSAKFLKKLIEEK